LWSFYASSEPERHYVLNLSSRSFVCYPTYEHNIFKMSEPVLMPDGTNGLWGKSMKQSTVGSKVKVTRGQIRSQEYLQSEVSQELCYKF